jgi:hypothetical protein
VNKIVETLGDYENNFTLSREPIRSRPAASGGLAPVKWVEDEGGIGILGTGGRKPKS